MFKVSILYIFAFLAFCNGQNRVRGRYDQIVLNVSHPVTAFWMLHNAWPTESDASNYDLHALSWNSLTIPNYWIISSLWPSKNDGEHPTSCYNGDPPRASLQSRLINGLRIEWPELTSRSNEMKYWRDAWATYGTCMIQLGLINDENDYFSIASQLLANNNLGLKIKGYKLYSGGSYDLSQLQDAIRGFLNIDGSLQCVEDEYGNQYLLGGSICFSKSLVREECVWITTTCDDSKKINLPNLG